MTVPAEVLMAYERTGATTTPLGNGMVNGTWLATTSGSDDNFVLQRLHPMFNEALVTDSTVVSRELSNQGWDVPVTIPTITGADYTHAYDGSLWRASTFIDGTPPDNKPLSTEDAAAIGMLLASFHASLAAISYSPQFVLPHFHDTEFYYQQLLAVSTAMPDDEAATLTSKVMTAYQKLPAPRHYEPQLIHGDPQLNNMLFKDGKPFTILDLDTVMEGSIMIDIGDLLRSLAQSDIRAGRAINAEVLQAVVDGYIMVTMPEDSKQFTTDTFAMMRYIAVELSMRFLVDIVHADYFSWDDQRFTSRRDNHLSEAMIQWQIYNQGNRA